MSDQSVSWYYQAGDDRKGPFTSDQISALLSVGAVNEHTKVWSEALAEWTPLFKTELRALLGDRPVAPPSLPPQPEPSAAPATSSHQSSAAPPSGPATTQASTAHYTPAVRMQQHDNKMLGTIVRYACYLNAGWSALPIVQMVRQKTVEQRFDTYMAFEQPGLMLFFGLFLLGTMTLFLVWKYRSTANLFNQVGPQTVTPAGAVYWYFVPVLWFWKPVEAIGNLARGFGVDSKSSPAVGAWWLFFWVSAACAIFYGVTAPSVVTTVDEANSYIVWTTIIYVLDAVTFLALAEAVKLINEAQNKMMTARAPVLAGA
jgi:hypothetical protein